MAAPLLLTATACCLSIATAYCYGRPPAAYVHRLLRVTRACCKPYTPTRNSHNSDRHVTAT